MKRSKKIGILFMALIILAITPLWGSALELKDSLSINVDGYANESIWESAAADYFKAPSGGGAAIKVLADKKNVYIWAFTNDTTKSNEDTFSVSVSGIGGSHSIKVSRSGAKLSGSGTYAVDNSSTSEFIAEFRFPASITGPGKVTAKLIASDNGATVSGQATLNLTVPTTAPPTTTKPTTTTTTTPTEKPVAPTTKPSSGGNSGITIGGNSSSGGNGSGGSATLPPAGGTMTEGTPNGEQSTTAGSGNTDSMTTTDEYKEGTTELPASGNISMLGNNWILIASLVAIAIIIGILLYVVLSVRKKIAKKKK